MRSFKLVVAYDGTRFHGWQIQPGQRTVQGVLEEVLRSLLGAGGSRLHGAGRTDAGVHARGQVASFAAPTRLPARALGPLLNPALPDDIRVLSACEVKPGFHARRSASARRYSYRLLGEEDILLGRFAWFPGARIELNALARATRSLEGEHDFSAFRNAASSSSHPVCRVMRATWSPMCRGARLDIVADHFLYNMVRNIVGTALGVSRASDPAGAMAEILASRDRRRAGVTAPARGLCLEEVFYPQGETT